ncbi:alpha/beta hydrolase [Bacteroidia bacterium]|nr:alpha/beta hydrolase [Bacteroidia bacterium]
MKKTFILIFCLFLSLHLVAQEENIVLNTPTGAIYGTLYLPEMQATSSVVLLIAGSGPTDRNGNQPMMQNNSLKMLAKGLGQQGIASLRFDKRGIGESQAAGGKEEDLRFDHYIEDVRLWIDLLAKDTRFSSVTVAGHSEGSLIGLMASENNAQVQSFISIAGSALPADEIIQEQLENQPQQVKDMVFPILEKLKQGEQVSDVSPALYSLFRPSVQPYMISWMKYHPQTEIKKLDIPVLIIQGTNDIQISVNHADLLANANPKAEKKLIESMNHVLKKCDSKEQLVQLTVYTNPELPLADGLISAVVEFIKKN